MSKIHKIDNNMKIIWALNEKTINSNIPDYIKKVAVKLDNTSKTNENQVSTKKDTAIEKQSQPKFLTF